MMGPSSAGRRRYGALRDEVLHLLLHSATALSAREVTEMLTRPDGTTPALTTTLTVLDRLHRAGEVDKDRSEGGELRFSAARHEADVVADDMLDALLRSKDRAGALLSFAGSLEQEDLKALGALVERGKRNRGSRRNEDKPGQ